MSASRDPEYYFTDGSLCIVVGNIEFNVHKSLMERHCKCQNLAQVLESTVKLDDWKAFLVYLYQDIRPHTGFDDLEGLLSLIRISHSSQLDCPELYQIAKDLLLSIFPSGPHPFTHLHPQDATQLEQVLILATRIGLPIDKGVLYTLVTIHDFHGDEENPSGLSDSTIARCEHLLSSIIAHFTPILFTPPATAHMACTDIFADTWMNEVIQPALDNDGVYKPLETLERLKVDVDWGHKGLCLTCWEDKKAEWTDEQLSVWRLMDNWLSVGSVACT